MRDSRGFLFRLCKVVYAFRLLLPVASVQPFANEVANNICHNRNKKSDQENLEREIEQGVLGEKIKLHRNSIIAAE